ncbi:MAG: FAD-dependent oxidoreductase [Candidatus Methanodesulfokora washburnensis]|jgi:glutamate synthase (NADPH/NADH) small chain
MEFALIMISDRGGLMKYAFLCNKRTSRTGFKIAVVGAGPAGLSATGYLVCRGYEVDVYDKLPMAGGLMAFVIPKYRIPLENIQEGVKDLEENFGVKFNLSVKVCSGENYEEGDELSKTRKDLHELCNEYNAVLIATGTWRSYKLNIAGENSSNVISALRFLLDLHLHDMHLTEGNLPKLGRVVVIGGGLSAIDAAEESLLRGAQEVYLVYRRTKKEAPAGEFEINRLIGMGVKWIELAAPVSIIAEDDIAREVRFQRMKLGEPDETGRPKPVPIPGSEFSLEADIIVIAVGERPTHPLSGDLAKYVGENGRITVDQSFRIPGTNIFAAGDVATGPSKVGRAVEHGLFAARTIDELISTGKLLGG